MARLLALPQKFSLEDWLKAKQIRFSRSEFSRLEAEKLIAESNQLCASTRQLTHATTSDVDKELAKRIDDVDYWRAEVGRRQTTITSEIDRLNLYKTRFEMAIESLRPYLEIVNKCLTLRNQREGIDLVHDEIQENLFKERDTLLGVECLFKHTEVELIEQIRLNRKARYFLENNLCDKTIAIRVDNFAAHMTPHTKDLLDNSGVKLESYLPPSLKPEKEERPFTVHDWKTVTVTILDKAESELNHSAQLRGVLEGLFSQASSDLRDQLKSTEQAFYLRIREQKAVTGQLEDEHAELERQVNATQLNLENLLKTIAESERRLTLAESRMTLRTKRPNTELCLDRPSVHLNSEVFQLHDAMANLKHKVQMTERMLHKLIRNKFEVADDIKIKKNSIYIDEVQCAALRKSICVQQF